MDIKLIIQNKGENLIKDRLLSSSGIKPKKAYFFIGTMKDNGFEMFEDCIIDLKARKQFVIGIDKKNTTKIMLQTLLKYTKNIYVFNNNYIEEFDSNISIFEYENKAEIYQLCGNISEGGIKVNIATYTLTTFNLSNAIDKKVYTEYFENINSLLKFEECRKLDKEYIEELTENKEIFTSKQFTHNVMTISELLNTSDKKKTLAEKKEDKSLKSEDVQIEKAYDEEESGDVVKKVTIPKIDLSEVEDISIEIDIEDSIQKEDNIVKKNAEKNVEVEKTSEDSEKKTKKTSKTKKEDKEESEISENREYESLDLDTDGVLDLEQIILEKADIKLDKKSIEKKTSKAKEEAEMMGEGAKTISKKIDLNKVSNLIIELPSKPTKGKDVTRIKIANYIKDLVPNFFDILEKGKNVTKADGLYKQAKIEVEVVDVKSDTKYSDKAAEIFVKSGQTYLAFDSKTLKEIEYSENDIARIIKLSESVYHIEIVSKEVPEYRIWKKLCTQSFRGADRCYGLM